ncbi:MAG TPA: hypothetical protein P5234_15105 [Thermoanaerobaculaceae bacterium]|nr:hypothetical protein [Thermoanaerobaculaceae bacterium]
MSSTQASRTTAIFIRAIEAEDKAEALRRAIADPQSPLRFEVDPQGFAAIPRAPFAYWASERMRAIFRELPRFEAEGRTARLGGSTKNDFRFLRLWHEVLPAPYLWYHFAKGGSYSPFYADIYLVVKWKDQAREIEAELLIKYPYLGKNADFVLHRELPYFRPGLTWPRRTQSGLSLRAMPAGCIFGDKGPAAFVEGDDRQALAGLLAVMNSRSFRAVVDLQMAFGSYEVGVIQRTPFPETPASARARLASLARRAWSLKRSLDTAAETSHAFVLPALLQVSGDTLAARAEAWAARVARTEAELSAIQAEIDDICFALYGLSADDRRRIEQGFGASSEAGGEANEETEDADEASEPEGTADAVALTAALVSWAVGVAFGRFDVRLATGERTIPPKPEPFDPLPSRSPGMVPEAQEPPDSPDILVDDTGHERDLLARVRAVFDRVFGEKAHAALREAAETLSAKDGELAAWLRESFFEWHIKRYSKSRRKAPIYWQLATPSSSYSVWLYYHRFTRDTLYRVLNDYVAPKLKHEERKLTNLVQGAGPNPSASQRREIDAQERFVEELRALREEAARVAPLWNPDLNDGVIINFAPLWSLVPQHKPWQKECKACWDKLASGDHDWAHLAMHLWPERVVPRCITDRSLAIAHDLEAVFWEEGADGKWKPRKVGKDVVDRLIAERTSASVKAALESLIEAPAPGGGRGAGKGRAARKTRAGKTGGRS